MSESIIQTHTSSLLEEAGWGMREGAKENGREGGKRGKKEGIKDGERGRERKMCPDFHINLQYMFRGDESKCDMDVMLRYFRGHFKCIYQEGWNGFKMAPLSLGSKQNCIFKKLGFFGVFLTYARKPAWQ